MDVEMKKMVKSCRKLFTNNKSRDIISLKNNPSIKGGYVYEKNK